MNWRRLLWAALFAAGLAACTTAEEAPVAQSPSNSAAVRGQAYAAAHCSRCHEVSALNAPSPNPDAPAFAAIAATPGMTSIAFNAWMYTSHPSMPDFVVAQEHVEDLWAYFVTLKSQTD